MKKIIALLFIVFFYSSCVREKYTDLVNSDSNKEMFVGNWTVSYVDNVYYIKLGNSLLFNSDGTHTIFYSNYQETGFWTLNGSTFTSNILDNSKTTKNSNTTYEIEKISDKELILNSGGYRVKFIKN